MEGLDITEINRSGLAAKGANKRIDAEFYSKIFVANEALLSKWKRNKASLGEITTAIDVGHVGPMAFEYVESGVPLLQTQNVGEFRINYANCIKISEQFHRKLKKSQVFPGDSLIARSGSIGNAAFVLEDDPQPLNSADIIIVRADASKVTNGYLAAFLNSRLGALQIERFTSGGVQGHINLKSIEHLVVILPAPEFQGQVHKTLVRGMLGLRKADELQIQAEQTLLRVLGLEDWKPTQPLTYTRRASEVFEETSRLDAEHWHEKFYAARKKLKKSGAEEFIPLADLISALTNGQTPLHHDLTIGEVPFLCAEHVSDFEVQFDSKKRVLAEHHLGQLARTALQEGDVLMTIKGRVGNTAIVEKVPGAVNINQDVALLRLNNRLPKWFVVSYLNSRFGKLAVEQHCTGAINPFLGLSNIRRLLIPRFQEQQMVEIAEETRKKVHAARTARQNAQALLAKAKSAVEVAIEVGEDAANKLLKED